MYPSYPAGAQMPEVQRPPAPPSITNAVRIMYAGAVISLIGVVIDIVTVNATKAAIKKRSPHLTASQINAAQHTLVIGFIISGVLAAAVWILIARMCQNGKNWARITGTVFFVIATVDAVAAPLAPEAAAAKLWALLVWLVGLAAVILLWRRSSSDFFSGMGPS